MADLSEGERQSLDDALSTLDDLYEVALRPDCGFTVSAVLAPPFGLVQVL